MAASYFRGISPQICMNMSNLLIMLAVLMSSMQLSASEIYPPILRTIDAVNIDTSYQLISSYDRATQEVFVQLNLSEESIVALELYDTQHKMVKVWLPEIAQVGTYSTELNMTEIPDGKYRMLVHINEEIYQQAVFKF